MAEIKAYRCDLCGIVTERLYNEVYFVKAMQGKLREGVLKFYFEGPDPDICQKCAETLALGSSIFKDR